MDMLCSFSQSSTLSSKYKCNTVPKKYKCTNTVAKHWNELWIPTKQLRTVTREEQAEELARAGMANNAASRCSTMAVLKSALAKQLDNGEEATIVSYVNLCRTLNNALSNIEQYEEMSWTILKTIWAFGNVQ